MLGNDSKTGHRTTPKNHNFDQKMQTKIVPDLATCYSYKIFFDFPETLSLINTQ